MIDYKALSNTMSSKTMDVFNEKYVFFKQVLVSSSTILAVLVALNKGSENDTMASITFFITIALLSLTVLLGVIVQYGKVAHLKDQIQAIDKLLQSRPPVLLGSIDVPYSKAYKRLETTFVFFFATSLISLVVYAFFIAF